MITENEIDQIQLKIIELVKKQVTEGEQSKDNLCCGQFLNYPSIKQRGLHGTNSAIMVLARSGGNEYNKELKNLISYVEKRYITENSTEEPYSNIIKISETLYALSFVKVGASSTDNLKEELQKKLKNSIKHESGWSYFINDDSTIELLPTAYAVLALHSTGYIKSDDKSIKYLQEEIMKYYKDKDITDSSVFSFIITSLYILTFLDKKIDKEKKKIFRQLLKRIWKSQFCHMNHDIEQNIEYWKGEDQFYVRIPWQLYLIALVCELYPKYFATISSRNRMKSILLLGRKDGFRYEFSGPYPSTRTNAILFDTLFHIKTSIKNMRFYALNCFFDMVRNFIQSRIVKIIVFFFSVIIIMVSIFKWINSDPKFEDIASNVLSAILVSLLMIEKKE